MGRVQSAERLASSRLSVECILFIDLKPPLVSWGSVFLPWFVCFSQTLILMKATSNIFSPCLGRTQGPHPHNSSTFFWKKSSQCLQESSETKDLSLRWNIWWGKKKGRLTRTPRQQNHTSWERVPATLRSKGAGVAARLFILLLYCLLHNYLDKYKTRITVHHKLF